MNLLAFDTSTDQMSMAVQRTAHATQPLQVWTLTAPGGAQTSAHLIPAILGLMAQAQLRFEQLDAIVFGHGPGSFTGLRTACAVAQGLAFGAAVPVLPVDTLLAVAEEARFLGAPTQAHYAVVALLDARMDEMYAGRYVFNHGVWTPTPSHTLMRPEQLACEADWAVAGNVLAPYGARLAVDPARYVAALPTAAALLRLAPQLLGAGGAMAADQALPLYVRDKVAKTTAERAAEKAAL
jgi:tRNA threonylcarbamoyladenosine biosynthesis protein TsaB